MSISLSTSRGINPYNYPFPLFSHCLSMHGISSSVSVSALSSLPIPLSLSIYRFLDVMSISISIHSSCCQNIHSSFCHLIFIPLFRLISIRQSPMVTAINMVRFTVVRNVFGERGSNGSSRLRHFNLWWAARR